MKITVRRINQAFDICFQKKRDLEDVGFFSLKRKFSIVNVIVRDERHRIDLITEDKIVQRSFDLIILIDVFH